MITDEVAARALNRHRNSFRRMADLLSIRLQIVSFQSPWRDLAKSQRSSTSDSPLGPTAGRWGGGRPTVDTLAVHQPGSRRVQADAGVHLTRFMCVPDIVRKMESSAHVEYNRAEYKSGDSQASRGSVWARLSCDSYTLSLNESKSESSWLQGTGRISSSFLSSRALCLLQFQVAGVCLLLC